MYPNRHKQWYLAGAVLGLVVLFGACALEEGSSPTSNTPPVVGSSEGQPAPTAPPAAPGTAPPTIVSPEGGEEVGSQSPTLTVRNATTTDGPPTYTFQVATDRSFNDIVAREGGVREGSDGKTAWQVEKSLEARKHFWRAYADLGTSRLTSEVADFTVPEESEPSLPGVGGGGQVILTDSLTNGGSVGQVSGGAFTSRGWEVRAKNNFIRYNIPPLAAGYVEFDTWGLQRSNPSLDQFMLFGMWDPNRGDYRANPFRVHLQKLDPRHNGPYLRLRWIAQGEQHDEGNGFLNWEPFKVYTWRIQWGPAGARNTADVFMNGNHMITVSYSRAYNPSKHYVELGIAERAESIQGVVYSNVEIGRR